MQSQLCFSADFFILEQSAISRLLDAVGQLDDKGYTSAMSDLSLVYEHKVPSPSKRLRDEEGNYNAKKTKPITVQVSTLTMLIDSNMAHLLLPFLSSKWDIPELRLCCKSLRVAFTTPNMISKLTWEYVKLERFDMVDAMIAIPQWNDATISKLQDGIEWHACVEISTVKGVKWFLKRFGTTKSFRTNNLIYEDNVEAFKLIAGILYDLERCKRLVNSQPDSAIVKYLKESGLVVESQ